MSEGVWISFIFWLDWSCWAGRTLSLYEDMACARTLDVMLRTAPCSVCIIMAEDMV